MITTLAALAAVCLLSLAFILVIPYFAATRVFMSFLPRDIREAAKAHPDPSVGKQAIGYSETCAVLMLIGTVMVLTFGVAHHVFCGMPEWLYRERRNIWDCSKNLSVRRGSRRAFSEK